MANKQNGNPNLMQFQSFPPLLRVEILSLHIRTIHLPCMTKITSFVIFSPRESLHVSLCIIPLLKYCEMDEFCRAKQFKLFISAFSLVSTKLLKSFSKKNKQKKTHTSLSYMQLRQLIKTSPQFYSYRYSRMWHFFLFVPHVNKYDTGIIRDQVLHFSYKKIIHGKHSSPREKKK